MYVIFVSRMISCVHPYTHLNNVRMREGDLVISRDVGTVKKESAFK